MSVTVTKLHRARSRPHPSHEPQRDTLTILLQLISLEASDEDAICIGLIEFGCRIFGIKCKSNSRTGEGI